MSGQSVEVGGAATTPSPPTSSPLPPPPPPPPAPPLPPQSPTASLAASVIARFAQNIKYGARVSKTAYGDDQGSPTPGLSLPRSPPRSEHENSSSCQDLREIAPLDYTWKSPSVPPGIDRTTADRNNSPVPPRTTSHRTGVQILAFDISPCRTRAVLAGRDILKTLAVDDATCTEDFNLRTNIIRYATIHEPVAGRISAKHKDQLAAIDVKWSNGEFDTTIATAASNGQVVVYDLNRAGVELARLHEHTRQVHRVGFNPHRGNLLLSGSQDGTTRLWDLRALTGERSVMTCQSKSRYTGNSEGIRDLHWSPTNGVEFAVGTDNGVVQRWDIRKESAPSLKVNAHEKTINSVHWHPDGKHLLSGSSDKTIKIWDFSSSDRRMKPSWQIQGPQPVFNVRWRPATSSTDGQARGNWHCTQLAASYDSEAPQIHIWDLRRPFLAAQILRRLERPTDILWHSEDLFWSVDLSGTFTQTDVKFAPKPIDAYNVNPMSIAPDGRFLCASMRKGPRRLPLEAVTDNLLKIERREASGSGRNSTTQSSTPGSHEEPILLGSTFKARRGKALNQWKNSARLLDNATLPSTGSEDAVLPLEQSLQERYLFKQTQKLAIGLIPGGLMDTEAFKFMARHYLPPPEVHASNRSFDLHLVLSKTFSHNARVAKFVGRYRLAQTWRILAQAVERELGLRADNRYEERRRHSIAEAGDPLATSAVDSANSADVNDSLLPKSPNQRPTTSLPELGDGVEALSNDAETKTHPPSLLLGSHNNIGKDQIKAEQVSSRVTTSDQLSADGASNAQEPAVESGLDELERQIAERRAAMDTYRAQPRPVLKLDDPFRTAEPRMIKDKASSHDSNEIFQMFSASTESSHKAKSTAESFEEIEKIEAKRPITDEDMDDDSKAAELDLAESIMDFDDDDDDDDDDNAGMGSSEHLQTSPKSSTSSTKPKGKTKISTSAEDSMIASNVTEDEGPVPNFDDVLPFKYMKPPAVEREHVLEISEHMYIESDFFAGTFPTEQEPEPWTVTAMFGPLIEYYTQSLHDSQFPAYLILHLAPWLIVTLPREHAFQIVATYLDRLISLELYKEAAEIRLYCEKYYPELEDFRGDEILPGGLWCSHCKKPSKGNQRHYCERCQEKWDPCAVCRGYDIIFKDRSKEKTSKERPVAKVQEANDAEWGWCDRCSHGGHIGCLRSFWNHTEQGTCPAAGCRCDCVPGSGRAKYLERIVEEERKTSHPVAKDSWKVGESSAVQRARVTVGKGEARRGILQGGRGAEKRNEPGRPVTLAAAGRTTSGGKKSVMFDIPDDKGEGEGNGKEYRRGAGGRGMRFGAARAGRRN